MSEAKKSFPQPPFENMRLRRVRQALRLTENDQLVLNEYAKLATEIAHAPVGALSVVEKDKVVFVAAAGMAFSPLERDVAFCAHTVALADQPLYVPDTLADERFKDNPLVVEGPKFRFYFGVPIALPGDSFNVGSLCVLDTSPNFELWPEQKRLLLELGKSCSRALELLGGVEGPHPL